MNELIAVENKTVLEAFASKNGLDPILQEVTELVEGFDHDMTTLKGRDETRALASNVAKFKVRVDELGKGLTEEWRQQTKLVNQSRDKIKTGLDALKIVARQPLTEWEEAQAKIAQEKADIEAAEKAKAQFESDHEIGILLDDKYNRDAAEVAQKAAEEAAAALAIEEKAREEREAKIAAEAAENAKKEAAEKADREEADRKQIEQNRVAEQQAKDANAKAELERQKAATAKAKKDAAESKQRAAEAVVLAKENARKEQEAIIAEEARQAALREANKKHQAKINNEAVDGLIAAGIDPIAANLVVKAIAKKQIPNVSIRY